MALVYSYLRFSYPEQSTGDSLRRQLQLSESWCRERGLILDDSLRIRDEGVSAYDGTNVTAGALRDFLSRLRKRVGSTQTISGCDETDIKSRGEITVERSPGTEEISESVDD